MDILSRLIYTDSISEIPWQECSDCCVHVLCLDGTMEFSCLSRTFMLSHNEIAVIVMPQEVVSCKMSDDFRCLAFVVPLRFLNAQLPSNHFGIGGSVSLYENPILSMQEREAKQVREDLLNIGRRINEHGHLFYERLIGSLALTMMYDLFAIHAQRDATEFATERTMHIVKSFMRLLDMGLSREYRTVGYYAEKLNVSPKYLSDTIKRQTGQSVLHFIDTYTIPILKSYLEDTDLSIVEIAEKMNFSSASYFTRYATRLLGVSPKAYRQTMQPKT